MQTLILLHVYQVVMGVTDFTPGPEHLANIPSVCPHLGPPVRGAWFNLPHTAAPSVYLTIPFFFHSPIRNQPILNTSDRARKWKMEHLMYYENMIKQGK